MRFKHWQTCWIQYWGQDTDTEAIALPVFKGISLSWCWQDGCLVSSLVEDQIKDQLLEAENSCLIADSSPSRCSNGWTDDSFQGKPAHNHDNHPEAEDCQRDSWLLSAAICPVCSHRRCWTGCRVRCWALYEKSFLQMCSFALWHPLACVRFYNEDCK